jgi:hypothetical protein
MVRSQHRTFINGRLIPPSLGLATPSETEGSGAVKTESAPPPEVLSCPVKGMYRLLDLIMEQGSNGLGNSFYVANFTTLTAPQQLIKL